MSVVILIKFYIYNIDNLHCLLDCKKASYIYFTYKKDTPPFSRLSAACLFMYIVTLELYRMSVWLNSLTVPLTTRQYVTYNIQF